MRILQLQSAEHDARVSTPCPDYTPNVKEDCLLMDGEELIGLYIANVNDYDLKLGAALHVANAELRSGRVPLNRLDRTSAIDLGCKTGKGLAALAKEGAAIQQVSAQLGSIPPNPRLRRVHPGYASTHTSATAKTFVKAMLGCAEKGMELLNQVAPTLHEQQLKAIEGVPEKWRFGKHFTSSISNFNGSVAYHRDTRNVIGSLNFIYCKRANSRGGCLNVPDYGATFEQPDNSLLIYPAWRNVHGVTPITTHENGGYRNTLIFYSLDYFLND